MKDCELTGLDIAAKAKKKGEPQHGTVSKSWDCSLWESWLEETELRRLTGGDDDCD